MSNEKDNLVAGEAGQLAVREDAGTGALAELDHRLVAFARTPDEMRTAQVGLVAWVTDKVKRERAEARELGENYKIAQASKWRSGLLKRHWERAKARVVFFEKILTALEAGYVIVPDFPIDVFAVRVTRSGPRPNTTRAEHDREWAPHAPDPAAQATDAPPAGEGRYVAPGAEIFRQSGQDGATKWQEKWAENFRDVDFPFALAKTEIVSEAAHAAAIKVFDELGVMEGGVGDHQPGRAPERNPDPLVIGRVVLPGRNGLRRHAIAFLVTWHLDVRDLDRIK